MATILEYDQVNEFGDKKRVKTFQGQTKKFACKARCHFCWGRAVVPMFDPSGVSWVESCPNSREVGADGKRLPKNKT